MNTWFTTTYHPQANGQVKRFNKTLVQRLRHYVAEQRDWDRHVEPLTYAYIYQVHRTTGTTPFDLVLNRHLPSINVRPPPAEDFSHFDNAELTPAEFKRFDLPKVARTLAKAKAHGDEAQNRYKEDFDKKVRGPLKVEEGD